MKKSLITTLALAATLLSTEAANIEYKARQYAETTPTTHTIEQPWQLKKGEAIELTLEGDFSVFPTDTGDRFYTNTPSSAGTLPKGLSGMFTVAAGDVEFSMVRVNDMSIRVEGVNYLVVLSNEFKDPKSMSCNIYLARTASDQYRWYLEAEDRLYYGDIEGAQGDNPITITMPERFLPKVQITQLSRGKITLPAEATLALELPYDVEFPEQYLKYDYATLEGVSELSLSGTSGVVTRQELEDLARYFTKRPMVTTNYQNTIFGSWSKAYMMEWTYEQTQSRELIDRLIEQSEVLMENRDDKRQKYGTRIGEAEAEFVPSWHHFRGVTYVGGKIVKKRLGVSDLGVGLNHPSAAARTIAHHPELWDLKYDATRSYKEVAQELLQQSLETWDYILRRYYDPNTHLLRSPEYTEEPTGRVPQWNRVFPILTAGNTIVDTYEIFGFEDERVAKIDKVLAAMLDYFFKFSYTVEINGKECLQYPYGVLRWDVNTYDTEDIGHMGFDARAFKLFDESGRYWSEEQTELVVNTVNEFMIKDNKGTVSNRMNGAATTKNYNNWGALPDMLWFAERQPELDDKLVEYVVAMMKRNGYLDGRVVYGVLHLRAARYGVEAE